ncbi:MAG: hypothetical protein IPI49_29485 [Myxococcales bacterium]|nr:hypothetical protein [Myxococcales bacterium]
MRYFERKTKTTDTYRLSYERHLAHLRSQVLLALVESFERFVKELGATCVNQIVPLVLDDRLSVLPAQPRAVAAHFEGGDLGRAFAEGNTWLDCDEINRRFKHLLADPFEENGRFVFFPMEKKNPDAWRRGTMDVLWQLRHSIVHNVGAITRSDAAKLRLLVRYAVDAPKMLNLSNGDVWYAKLFLDELVTWANRRVAERLGELLTTIHQGDPSLFDPGERASQLARMMKVSVTVASVTAG